MPGTSGVCRLLVARMITARRFRRATMASLPKWLAIAVALCMLIPGFFDDIAALVIVAGVLIVQPWRVPRFRSAWRGGKSHRAHDARRAAHIITI